MLQIRLNKASAPEGGSKPSSVETVTVACPDHLVIADLPVAKSLGSSTTSFSASVVKTVGRRSRRLLGERIHFCVRCDFPIAIYGRLSPCEHAFCLACARSDSSCYICDERIQKIQTIKMLEGIYICAAPHCLKSFLKRSEFEAHVYETHSDLLQKPNAADKEVNIEVDSGNISKPPFSTSSDAVHGKQAPLDSSFTHAQPRQANFSPSSDSQQVYDRDDKGRRHPRETVGPLKPLQPPSRTPAMFYSRHPSVEPPQDNNPQQQVFDRAMPYPNNSNMRYPLQQQGLDNANYPRESDQLPERQLGILPEPTSFAEYQAQYAHQKQPLPNFPGTTNLLSQSPNLPLPYGYQTAFPAETAIPQPPHNNSNSSHFAMARPDSEMGLLEQGAASLLGFHGPTGISSSYPRPWIGGQGSMPPFESMTTVGQGLQEGYANMLQDASGGALSTQSQGKGPFYQGEYNQRGKAGMEGVSGGLSHLPPPPPPPLSQLKSGKFSSGPGGNEMGSDNGQGYGWQNERRGFGSSQD